MAQRTQARKGQFCGNAPIEIGKPEIGGPGFYSYGMSGPDGATEHHVAVTPGSNSRLSRSAIPTDERRAAERAKSSNAARELTNIRNILVKIGPSLPDRRAVLRTLSHLGFAIAREGGEAPALPYIKTTMRKARPDASPQQIDDTVKACMDEPPVMPDRQSAGAMAKVTAEVWQTHNSPSYIHPFDRTLEWTLATIDVRKKVQRDQSGAKYEARRPKAPKKPRKKTQAETAKELGMSLRTYERRLRAEREAKKEEGGAVAENQSETSKRVSRDTLIVEDIGVSENFPPHAPSDQDRTAVGARTAKPQAQPPAAVPTDPMGQDAPAPEIPVCGPDQAGNQHALTMAAPIYLDPDDDDDEYAAEVEARCLEKAAWRAERAAHGPSPPRRPDRPDQHGGPQRAAPSRPRGTLRHPGWADDSWSDDYAA